ncbi:MAG: protein O-GlcNAcase [Verrucomicrobia subdivision 3 bacterium]|nr:protein O-GlcNAcase [Limisphaerales bacterium]
MATHETTDFLAGVIEGFYGQPWTQAERLELFDWMAAWGLNTYLYAPKDDLKHRALWRELYAAAEAEALGHLVKACRQRNIHFVYALSPGLDIRYSNDADLDRLKKRFEQMLALGCQDFALLFDDIPDRLDSEDIQRWGSLAAAQCHVTNAMFRWTRDRETGARFLFCPTAYCSRMVWRNHGGENFLPTIGRELLSEIDVFWTGPEIISREITVSHVQELELVLRRKPVIWDNLHANDYDGRRFYCGPYTGRCSELRRAVRGLLSNPNCEFPLNYVPLRTLAEFVRCGDTWKPREAYLLAVQEWFPRFATATKPITLEDLILFGDCYYLPHEEGPEAEALYECARSLLAEDSERNSGQVAAFRRQARRLREFCARMAELRHRPLFYALSRRIWELREELELLEQHMEAARADGPSGDPSLTFHLPGTYRGGMVAKLQRLLVQNLDGTFTPDRSDERVQQVGAIRQATVSTP